jgi:acetyltransferase-like isoleucine patch superfamily enzyme
MNFIIKTLSKILSKNPQIMRDIYFSNKLSYSVSKYNDISGDCHFTISKKAKSFSLGYNISFRDNCTFIAGDQAVLEIGNHVIIHQECVIHCMNYISIGEGSILWKGVKIYDHNQDFYTNGSNEHDALTDGKIGNTAPVIIGMNCWLGSNSVVFKGVTIGNNVFIDEGCIINSDIPDHSMVINREHYKRDFGKFYNI